MTHPLVSAFHRYDVLSKGEGQNRNQEVREALQLLPWVSEVMASIPQVSCFVGFLHGHNNRPMMIWLWPLSGIEEYHYWLDDKNYYRVDKTQRDVLIVLPYFLRS